MSFDELGTIPRGSHIGEAIMWRFIGRNMGLGIRARMEWDWINEWCGDWPPGAVTALWMDVGLTPRTAGECPD